MKEDDLLAWAIWMETADRKVAYDVVNTDLKVSTVFLGLDDSYYRIDKQPGYKPQLFETMVFRNGEPTECQCYATWGGAEHGHNKMVEKVKAELLKE